MNAKPIRQFNSFRAQVRIGLVAALCLAALTILAATVFWLPENENAARRLDPTTPALACDPDLVWVTGQPTPTYKIIAVPPE